MNGHGYCTCDRSSGGAMSIDALRALGWNVEQILVYIWQCVAGDATEQEYPFKKFLASEMGRRLMVELAALAAPASETEKLPAIIHEIAPIVRAHLKREMEHPANHQEFQREAAEKLDRFEAALKADRQGGMRWPNP